MKLFDQWKAAWLAWQETQLREEFRVTLDKIRGDLVQERSRLEEALHVVKARTQQVQREQEEATLLEHRVADRKTELARANEELKQQLRLIEAKAAPDSVWLSSFSLGWAKAWDAMWPLMADGVAKVRAKIEEQAIEATLQRLEPVLQERLTAVGRTHLKPIAELLAKQRDLEADLLAERDPLVRQAYEHYLQALGWALTTASPGDHGDSVR